MLMTCPKCGQLVKGQTGDQCSKCKIFLHPASEMGEIQRGQERFNDEPSTCAGEDTVLYKGPKCGWVETNETAKFCSKCGSPLKREVPETPAKKGSGAGTILVWMLIILLLMALGKANHQKWVDEKMEHFRGTDYTYSDKEMQKELDKIFNTFGR